MGCETQDAGTGSDEWGSVSHVPVPRFRFADRNVLQVRVEPAGEAFEAFEAVDWLAGAR